MHEEKYAFYDVASCLRHNGKPISDSAIQGNIDVSRKHRSEAKTFIDDQGIERRTFRARGSFADRCDACMLPRLNCLCPYQVTTTARAEVWLIMHPYEAYKPTNTGRLIKDVLPSTRIFLWSRTEPDAELLTLLASDRYQPFLIFPDDQPDYADRIVREPIVEGARIPVFIILDGTWRQARRMFRRSAYLAALPILPLHTERLTRYKLRTPASESHLCTAEVAAELLKKVGDVNASQLLDDYFDTFNDCYAASRVHHRIKEPTEAMQRLLAWQGVVNGDRDPSLSEVD